MTAAMNTDRPFLEGINPLPADQFLAMGLGGPSMNTIKKSQSAIDCKHPCVYQYGSCSFGDECKFAETDGKVCAKFLKGGCSWGDHCCWKHIAHNPKPSMGAGAMGNQQKMGMGNRKDGMNNRRFDGQMKDQGPYSLNNQSLAGQNLLGDFNLGNFQNNFPSDDLPFNSNDDPEMMNNQQIQHLVTTVLQTIRTLDERYNDRVSQLQIAIEQAEQQRNEEGERNRRSISALMHSVDGLIPKLKELGIPIHNLPMQNMGSGLGGGGIGGVGGVGDGINGLNMNLHNINDLSANLNGINTGAGMPAPKPSKQKSCMHCGKTGRLMLCSRCKVATFCDERCQREAWHEHSKTCTPPEASYDMN